MSVDILADDLHFAEGPRWHQGTLWFSDFYDHAVKTVDLDGTVQTKLTVEGQPSGLGWMPDGRMLVVSMLDRLLLRLEHVADDGTLSNRREWATFERCTPDGICLDRDGAVWVADASSARCLRVREGGEVLEEVETEQHCYACMLGGPDGRTLFMLTAAHSDAERASATRTGRILTTRVGAAHAGRP